jgi:hypothetical protein
MAVLLLISFILGATYGATIWALESIFFSNKTRKSEYVISRRRRPLRLFAIGAFGYLALVSFSGPTLIRDSLNLLAAIPLAFAATILPETLIKRDRDFSAKDSNSPRQAEC